MCTAKKMHCKDANTVYISVQSILLEISGKGGRQKEKERRQGEYGFYCI